MLSRPHTKFRGQSHRSLMTSRPHTKFRGQSQIIDDVKTTYKVRGQSRSLMMSRPHTSLEVNPQIIDDVKTTIQDQTLISVPAPGGGPVILSIMNILEGYHFKSGDKNQTKTVHRILKAFKFGFAQQQELADPKFESLALNATSKITVNYWFGSKIMTDTGILLNNQMADFADHDNPDTKNNKLNYIAPGKRPLSNMAPVILYNQDSPCKMRLVIGGANGSRIITGVTEVLLNVVSFGLTMADAISAPRIHTQLYPSEVEYEEGFPQKVIDELEKMGHKMVKASEGLNEVQGIKKVNNRINAVSDYRKGGKQPFLIQIHNK
ncbi:CD224 [Mytilus edulis]|uniref:GGT1_5 n=1 Tax=Mytilus edulis TaxID=6550 RepID=A0A8S3R1V5_MYTED|nr:CD224 [Mytilus edulis]